MKPLTKSEPVSNKTQLPKRNFKILHHLKLAIKEKKIQIPFQIGFLALFKVINNVSTFAWLSNISF